MFAPDLPCCLLRASGLLLNPAMHGLRSYAQRLAITFVPGIGIEYLCRVRCGFDVPGARAARAFRKRLVAL